MSKSAVVTARLDPETLKSLDELAVSRERTRAWLVEKAVKRFVEEENDFAAFIKAGEDAIDNGDYLTQEEMEAWFEDRYRSSDAA